jgi:hypothetical protein
MKFFLLTIVSIFLSINAFAQNWQTLNSRVSYVYKNNQEAFVVFDSVKTRVTDTLLYNFKNIRQVRNASNNNYNIYSGIEPSWLGEVVVIKPNGTNVFLNGDGDSIYIETKASLGTTFAIYNNTLKNLSIVGRVDSVVLGEVLGVADSLKYITILSNGIQGYDGVNSIVLSKNYGIKETITFLNVGYQYFGNLSKYNSKSVLFGHTQIPGTYVNLSDKDIFDFNVGDELHISEYKNGPSIQNPYQLLRIEKTLSRRMSDNLDTIIYTVDVCEVKYKPSYSILLSSIHEVQTIKYVLNSPAGLFNSIPGKVYSSGIGRSYRPFIKSRQVGDAKILGGNQMYMCALEDSCAEVIDGIGEPDYYYKGLGGPYFNHPFFIYGSDYRRELAYSKKGTVEKGTPFDCDAILAVNDDQLGNQKVKVYPNPVKDKLTITTDELATVSIKSIIGVEVYTGQLNAGKNEVNISHLSSGLYFVIISTEDTSVTEKIVVD